LRFDSGFLVKTAARAFCRRKGSGARLHSAIRAALLRLSCSISADNLARARFLGSLGNFLVILFNAECMPVSAELHGSHTDRLSQLVQGGIYAYC
jgi:hypothetical protein